MFNCLIDYLSNLLRIILKNIWRFIKFTFITMISFFISYFFAEKISFIFYGKDDKQFEFFLALIGCMLGFLTSLVLSNKQFKTEIYKNEIYPTYQKYRELIDTEYQIFLDKDKFKFLFYKYNLVKDLQGSIKQEFIHESVGYIFNRNLEYLDKIFHLLCKSKKLIEEYLISYYKIEKNELEEKKEDILRIIDIYFSDYSIEKMSEHIEFYTYSISKEFKGYAVLSFIKWLDEYSETKELKELTKIYTQLLKWEKRIVYLNTNYAEYQIRFDSYRDV